MVIRPFRIFGQKKEKAAKDCRRNLIETGFESITGCI